MLPQTTTATIGNMLPQDLKTIVFWKSRCYFAAETLNQRFENMMKQAFAATNKPVTIAASLCIHDAPLTYRLTDSLSYCRMEMMKHCNSSRSP